MTSKGKLITLTVLSIALLTAVLAAQPTLATPNMGSDCLQCHSAMPATKDNVKTSSPSVEPSSPTAQPVSEAQPTIVLPYVGDLSNLIGKNVAVTASALNVRASASLQAQILGSVRKSTVLSVLEQQSGWLKVKFESGTGWVYGYYVTLAPEPTAPAAEPRQSLVQIPSINDQTKTSRLGSRHWNVFKKNVSFEEDPEQDRCISCHSAVKMVDDPEAKLTDFLKKGQKYATGEIENPVTGETEFQYATATEDGKYLNNDFEGITCRVCHITDKNGMNLRKPDATCTQCHGRVFNWKTGSGHHVTYDFYLGHGEATYDPSVHYTLGMQCQDCHTMNAIKHDYEPAKPEDIVRDAKCQSCHQSAHELETIIETTQNTVKDSLTKLNARLTEAQNLISDKKVTDSQNLVGKAKARVNFINGDLSKGVHNPQFAAKLINEANKYLDQFNSLTEANSTPTIDLGNLTVYSQAQSSKLGNAHWDMLEQTISNAADPEQDRCISCHSAVKIVDDPQAHLVDFLKAGTKYCTEELSNPAPGQDPFVYSTAEKDGKYVNNYQEGITCRVCHTFDKKPGYATLRRNDEQTCGLCHGRTFNWNTGSGHHVELAFFKGQGSAEKGIPNMPSPKTQMNFACQDCHFMDSTKHDFEPATGEQIAANSNCSSCHTANSIDKMIEDIQKEVENGIHNLTPRLEAAKAYVDKNPTNGAAKEIYTQAQAGVTFIEDDFSEGVHNPTFARYLLERSANLLNDFESKFK